MRRLAWRLGWEGKGREGGVADYVVSALFSGMEGGGIQAYEGYIEDRESWMYISACGL